MSTKRKYILTAAVTLLVTAAVFSYVFHWRSEKDAALEAVVRSEASVGRAEAAYKAFAGESEELATVATALSLLNEASNDCFHASVLSFSGLTEAQEKAQQAEGLVVPLLYRLQAEYGEARNALEQQDYERAFSFCSKFPAASEAESLLKDAEFALFASVLEAVDPEYGSSLEADSRTLDRVFRFNKFYPKPEKPQYVIARTGNLLVDDAVANLACLKTVIDKNRMSEEKMSATHESQNFASLPENFVLIAHRVAALMSGLGMPTEMEQLFKIIVDANDIAVQVQSLIYEDTFLNNDELAQLRVFNEALSQKNSAALEMLGLVTSKYYKGTPSNNLGTLLGN